MAASPPDPRLPEAEPVDPEIAAARPDDPGATVARPDAPGAAAAGFADPELAAARAAVLRMVDTAFADRVPVVNSVRVANLSTPPAPIVDPSLSERAARRAERRAARALSRPDARIDFTEWVAIPWQARPMEARLADVAQQIGDRIVRSHAWRHTLLDTQRLRLNPLRETADIAYAAYRLYRLRLALGPRPAGPQNPMLAQAQQLFDGHFAGLSEAWLAMVDRVATLESYRVHLDDLAPLLTAHQTVERLTDVRLESGMTSIYADAARNELAAADTRDLTDSVDSIGGGMVAVLGRLDRDVRALTALGRRPLP